MAGDDHYLQFVEAVRGNGQTSAPFAYSGPLTEVVLLGCLSTRFPKTTLEWNAADMKITNVEGSRRVRAEAVPQGVGGGGAVSGEPGA